ncbi:hypothetical protein [Puia dinghuensis]|uniref:Uncharacterized protein n=1 Tax=Puia dinghuensis TaxID=1792502 RepID=A0A8J2UBI2_9BACT|nr:hypothetical protein [Puia dinghuensis]GGA94050.1 hypothetical protein GCM10011511_16690 [Puia dinghuensis]
MRTTPANQFFSFSRWSLLVGKHWVEHRRGYILSLLAIAGLLAVFFTFIILMQGYATLVIAQFFAFFGGLYFAGCLFSSLLFADLSTKKEALPWLSLPASQFEKLLCALLFSVVFFFIAYTVVFYCVDIPMVHWANNALRHHPQNWPNTNQPIPFLSVYNVFTAVGAPIPEANHHLFLYSYFTAQAVALLGSVYYTRYAFIKTVIVGVLFLIAFVLFENTVITPMLPRNWNNDVFRWDQMKYIMEPPQNEVRLPAGVEQMLITLIQFGLPPFFWFITYHRLKEKQV